MESGALSDPAFGPWAKENVVPFLHVTTRITGRKYDRLLSEKGFRSFPSLAFMDAEGNILAKPQSRSVTGFESTRTALIQHADLVKRTEAGEKGLDAAMLLCEYALGKIDGAAFKTRAASVTDATDEQKTAIAQINTDSAFLELVQQSRRGDLDDAAQKILAMLDGGQTPTAKSPADSGAWTAVNRYAMKTRDADLAKRSAASLKAAYADSRAADTYVKNLAEAADKLAALVALSSNKEMPAAERDLRVAMLEYDLSILSPKAFLDKAGALQAGVPADQKAALEAAMVKASFEIQVRASRTQDNAVLAEAATALIAMIDAGKSPPEGLALQVWNTVARHGMATSDPAMMERAADGFESTGNKRVENFVADLRKRAAALRDTTKN